MHWAVLTVVGADQEARGVPRGRSILLRLHEPGGSGDVSLQDLACAATFGVPYVPQWLALPTEKSLSLCLVRAPNRHSLLDMDLRGRWHAVAASQLGHPHGLPGLVLGRMLNRANKAVTTAAVDTLDIPPGALLADLGFGGGIGLELLLAALEDGGQVHGVDLSDTMLASASRRFRRQISTGLLVLHEAPIEHLPMETASLDGVIMLNTLDYISDLAGALNECARVLRPSGQLVIGLGDPEAMASGPVTGHGFRVRSLVEVTNALLTVGLEVDQHHRVPVGDRLYHLLVAQPY